MFRMLKLLPAVLLMSTISSAVDLPSKKTLGLAAVKVMVAGAEAEAAKRNADVTICIVDESGNILFLQKGDKATVSTLQFAQKKARHAAFFRRPSKDGADSVKNGSIAAMAYPDFFPNQGGLPILLDGQILGGIAASGSKSEIDEAIAQAGLDALFK